MRIVFITAIAAFITAFDISAMNIVLPVLSNSMNISTGDASLSITVYFLVLSGLILSLGRISDFVGFKKIFLYGFGIFAIGSILCGFSFSIHSLIVFRIIQAVGGAMFTAVGPAIITTSISKNRRGESLGIQVSMSALGFAMGPGMGGLCSDYLGWRWIFLFNVPIALFGIYYGSRYLPGNVLKPDLPHLDVVGMSASFLGITSILLGFSLYQVPGTPDAVLLFCFLVGLISLLVFGISEKRARIPLISPGIFRNRNFSLGVLSCFIVMALFSGVTYLLPYYLIGFHKLDPTLSGMIMTAPAVMSIIIAPISGWLSDMKGSRVVSAGCMLITIIAFFLFSTFNDSTSVLVIVLYVIIMRFSTTAFYGPNGRLIMSSCPQGAEGNASGIMMMVRYTGMCAGIALFQTIFAVRMYIEGVPRDGTPLVGRITHAMSLMGYQAVFLVAMLFAVLTLILVLQTRNDTT
ncbi:MAG: MFS transporter [Methanospirillum sp.]|nr:MFS transporter [Methanospirillum sp.]